MRVKVGIAVAIFLLSMVALYVKGDDLNTIAIDPQEQVVNIGENFTVNISIIPAEPVSSAVCNISFDPSKIRAISIENGGMFEIWLGDLSGVADIDNTNGTITYIMAASSSNKTQEGTFATITFQAIGEGTSYINIENPVIQGSSNVNVVNGNVTVIAGSMLTYNPISYDFGDMPEGQIANTTFEIWNSGTGTLSYSFASNCSWIAINPSVGLSNGEHNTITVTINTTNLSAGLHTCNISISSNGGNGVFAVEVNVIIDSIPPQITNVNANPSSQNAGSNVNITCNVTDNVALQNVFLNITYPDGSYKNFSIFSNKTGNIFYCNKQYNAVGDYSFFIYAIDTSNNGNKSNPKQFQIIDSIPPQITNVNANPSSQNAGSNVNITCNVTDNVALQNVFLNITYPDGSYKNFSIFSNKTGNIFYCNKQYNAVGDYSFFIYAIDTSNNGNKSNPKQFQIADIIPPNVEISYPSKGSILKGNVDIRWNATDNHDSRQEIKITIKYSIDDGLTWHNIVSNIVNSGSYTWNTSGFQDSKNYMIEVSAKDTSGNVGSDISSKFIVDNTPPSLEITKPLGGQIYLLDRAIFPTFGNKAIVIGKITITANATDSISGVKKVEFYIDGVKKAEDNETPYSMKWSGWAVGSHTIKVKAYDKAGNEIEKVVDVRALIL